MRLGLLVTIIVLGSVPLRAQRIEGSKLLTRYYNQVSFLVAHRAYSAYDYGIYQSPITLSRDITSQQLSVGAQLRMGVRGLTLDLHNSFGVKLFYFKDKSYGYKVAREVLAEVRQFLIDYPKEIITLFLHADITDEAFDELFTESNLLEFVYEKPKGKWNTLQEMIDKNQRLVVFTDKYHAQKHLNWKLTKHEWVSSTSASQTAIERLSCGVVISAKTPELFMLNHFVVNETTGFGSKSSATVLNQLDWIRKQALECSKVNKSRVNFLTLDFVNIGNGLQMVDELNGVEKKAPVDTKPTPPVVDPKETPEVGPKPPVVTPTPPVKEPKNETPTQPQKPQEPKSPVVTETPTVPTKKPVEPAPQPAMSFTMYPNPCNGLLQLKISNPKSTNLQIYSLSGRIMHQEQVSKPREHLAIDLRHFSTGFYVVQLGELTQMLKVVFH